MIGGALWGAAILPGLVTLPAHATRSPVTHRVVMEQFAFSPTVLHIRAGDSVEWLNRDLVPHTATHSDQRWQTEPLNRGEQVTITFETPGTETYGCRFHTAMQAQIIVDGP